MERTIYRWKRLLLGLSQDEIAKRADVHQANVSRLERGYARQVPVEARRRIARVLGIRPKGKSAKD